MREIDLLTLLIHEVEQPVNAAMLDLDRLRGNLRKLDERLRILEIARAEVTGKRDLLPPFQQRTVSKALDALKSNAGVAVVPELPRSLAVMVAAGALDAVLQSLLSNARRYAPRAAVTVRAYPLVPGAEPWPAGSPVSLPGRAVVIEVADLGPGIPAHLRPELFSLGAKADPEHDGMGIGLWLSRLVVRAHGGDLWLADAPKGAVFVSVWPMAPPKDDSRDPIALGPDGWPSEPREFAKAVRAARENAHLTRKDFSVVADISGSTLRNVETQRHRWAGATRRRLVNALARLGIAPALPNPEH